MTDEIKTKFRGPGEWLTQAKRLEDETPEAPEAEEE